MKKFIWTLIIIIISIVVLVFGLHGSDSDNIKIGIITDLSGPATYWGESTKAGADILQKELAVEGRNISFVFEDYQLDAAKAASAAQKLVNIDKVHAVYAEFNPGAIATASVLKDKNIPFVYNAAVVSPLEENTLFYKTYLDYKEGCRQIAQRFKNEGVTKIGLLKVNLEFGELCLSGIENVYGSDLISEGYNLGDTDFRTQLLKIKGVGAQVVINVGFEGDTINTLKVIRDMRYTLRYGTVDDTITEQVSSQFGNELRGAWTFGFVDPSPDFQENLKAYDLATPYGAAIAYTHLKQLVNALSECGNDTACVSDYLNRSVADQTIGFRSFNDRIADLDMNIKRY